MSIISPLLKKVSPHVSIAALSSTASHIVPIPFQVRGLKIYASVKEKLIKGNAEPVFVERPLPEVSTLALHDIDVSNPFLYRQNKWQSYFKRLRDECPIHYQGNSPFGAFWSITRYDDIVYVDKHHELFSAEPVITLGDPPDGLPAEMFIAMDPPKHDVQRKAVQGVVAPKNLAEMESLIRTRTAAVLDELPVNKPIDWVELVSVELTSRMLATLFDFPYDDRHKLAHWSDVLATNPSVTGGPVQEDSIFDAAEEFASYFTQIWRDKEAAKKKGAAPGYDLISLLLDNDNTKDMINKPMEFIGNLALLIVGGNDTTRNSMTGGVHALNQFPDEFSKLKNDPSLIPSMVSEIIRWQTPLAYMRRIAKQDVELHGKTIKKGDKLIMWYISGNRDERKIHQPDRFIIDRKNPRNHLSFGFGVHRCMGNRLAEMQLRILWEEILKRFDNIEVLSEPEIVQSNFVRGYNKMMVRLTPRKSPCHS